MRGQQEYCQRKGEEVAQRMVRRPIDDLQAEKLDDIYEQVESMLEMDLSLGDLRRFARVRQKY